MAAARRRDVICQSRDLLDSGPGVRFAVVTDGKQYPAFAVRYRGRAYAYRNVCAHRGVELDWGDGRFFDVTGLSLVCSTHGALYAPDTGACLGGACRGLGLIPIAVTESGDHIRLASSGDILFSGQSVTG